MPLLAQRHPAELWRRRLHAAMNFVDGGDASAGSPAHLDNILPLCLFVRARVHTLGNLKIFAAKTPAGSIANWRCMQSASDANLRCDYDRATANVQYVTNDGPQVLNVWKDYIWVIRNATPAAAIYHGRIGEPLRESTYSTANNGSGAFGSDSAENFVVGARNAGGSDQVDADIALVMVFEKALLLGGTGVYDLEAIHADPYAALRGAGSKVSGFVNGPFGSLLGFWDFSLATDKVVPDLSGYQNPLVLSTTIRPRRTPGPESAGIPRRRLLYSVGTGGATQFDQAVGGTITPAGALGRQAGKLAGGATAPAGSLVQQVQKLLSGSTAPAGSLVRQVQKLLSGSTAPAGSLVRQVQKLLAGATTPAGSLQAIKTFLLSVSGSTAPTGAVLRQVGKVLTGGSTPAGGLSRQAGKLVAGSTQPGGGLLKEVRKLLAGATAPSGALQALKTFLLTIGGTVGPAGTLAKLVGKGVSGSTAPAGLLRRDVAKSVGGQVAPGGGLIRQIAKRLAGATQPGGALSWIVNVFTSVFRSWKRNVVEVRSSRNIVAVAPSASVVVVNSARSSVEG